MIFSGNLSKMRTKLESPIQYNLINGEQEVLMNQYIGSQIGIYFTGQINCVDCNKLTKKAFGQGFCYSCFVNSPMNAECIIRPELCEAHIGGGRDPEWEKKHHLQPHYVYIALSSGMKVGVTRDTQIPTRWIDQGAWKALLLAKTENRRQAGEIEVSLKPYISDKTAWQRMLKNQLQFDADLIEMKEELIEYIPEILQDFIVDEDDVLELEYPVLHYPEKVKSINLDKTPTFEGKLNGIKGQYLIFDGGMVINIRKYSGYYVQVKEL